MIFQNLILHLVSFKLTSTTEKPYSYEYTKFQYLRFDMTL